MTHTPRLVSGPLPWREMVYGSFFHHILAVSENIERYCTRREAILFQGMLERLATFFETRQELILETEHLPAPPPTLAAIQVFFLALQDKTDQVYPADLALPYIDTVQQRCMEPTIAHAIVSWLRTSARFAALLEPFEAEMEAHRARDSQSVCIFEEAAAAAAMWMVTGTHSHASQSQQDQLMCPGYAMRAKKPHMLNYQIMFLATKHSHDWSPRTILDVALTSWSGDEMRCIREACVAYKRVYTTSSAPLVPLGTTTTTTTTTACATKGEAETCHAWLAFEARLSACRTDMFGRPCTCGILFSMLVECFWETITTPRDADQMLVMLQDYFCDIRACLKTDGDHVPFSCRKHKENDIIDGLPDTNTILNLLLLYAERTCALCTQALDKTEHVSEDDEEAKIQFRQRVLSVVCLCLNRIKSATRTEWMERINNGSGSSMSNRQLPPCTVGTDGQLLAWPHMLSALLCPPPLTELERGATPGEGEYYNIWCYPYAMDNPDRVCLHCLEMAAHTRPPQKIMCGSEAKKLSLDMTCVFPSLSSAATFDTLLTQTAIRTGATWNAECQTCAAMDKPMPKQWTTARFAALQYVFNQSKLAIRAPSSILLLVFDTEEFAATMVAFLELPNRAPCYCVHASLRAFGDTCVTWDSPATFFDHSHVICSSVKEVCDCAPALIAFRYSAVFMTPFFQFSTIEPWVGMDVEHSGMRNARNLTDVFLFADSKGHQS